MKSETQNIYNFCMEKKKKNVNHKKVRKWKLFFIVLAKMRRQEKKGYKNTVISSFVANVCSLQQQGESTINSFLIQ